MKKENKIDWNKLSNEESEIGEQTLLRQQRENINEI